METVLAYLLLTAVLLLVRSGSAAHGNREPLVCPKRCVCQVLNPNLATLCDKKGLLFVPPSIARRTVELRLGDNFITGIRRRDFANMTKLVDLTLSRNTIGSIAPHAFRDLENLRALHLDSNRLTRITNETFSGMVKLHHLILNNNQLTNIHIQAFNDLLALEELDLSYNNLESVPWVAVQRMISLHTLSLDHNMISLIPEGTFTSLGKLKRLDVTSNKLQKLPPDPVFQRAGVLATSGILGPTNFALSFGGNPLRCNCELLWLRRLQREDDLETCAAPTHLAGRYFWTVSEEEFLCEPPLITRHSPPARALEGQRVALRCKARGDPEPVIHWIAPDGRLVANSSRTAVLADGTLDILISTVKDSGAFTCVATNPSGDAQQNVELHISQLPHIANDTTLLLEPDPGSSIIATATRNEAANGATGSGAGGGAKGSAEKRVVIAEATSSSALVKFNFQRSIPGIRMFQIQYNGTYDDSLVYRMIPPTSKSILVSNLAAGTTYDLCVLAIYDDAVTSLTATRVIGCLRFTTEPQHMRCHFMQSQFLGGTIVVVIGGVIVASVLSFIVFLIVRYRVCHQGGDIDKRGLEMNVIGPAAAAGGGLMKSLSKQLVGGDVNGSGKGRKVSPESGGGGCGIVVVMPPLPPPACSSSSSSSSSAPPPPPPRPAKGPKPDCTVTSASAANHSWHPASPSPMRSRGNPPKAPPPSCSSSSSSSSTGGGPAYRQTDAQIAAEMDNVNRNNSAGLGATGQRGVNPGLGAGLGLGGRPLSLVAPPTSCSSSRGPLRLCSTMVRLPRRPNPEALLSYQTLPAGCVRVTGHRRRHSLHVDACQAGGVRYTALPHSPHTPGGASGYGSLRSKRSLSMSGDLPHIDSTEQLLGNREGLSRSEWLLESTL